MKITVGKLANIFKLNPETIRFYEKKGLINSERDEINNYRAFDSTSVQTISSIKRYRNMNFSLGEIQSIHSNIKTNDLAQLYEEKIEQQYNRLDEEQALLNNMIENKRFISNLDTYLYNPIIVYNKNFYFIPFDLEDNSSITYVVNKAPLSSSTSYNKDNGQTIGFMVEQKDIRFFNHIIDDFEYIHMDRCIKVVFNLINEKFDYNKQLEKINLFISKNNLKLKNISLTKHLLNHMYDNKAYHYGILYIEIE